MPATQNFTSRINAIERAGVRPRPVGHAAGPPTVGFNLEDRTPPQRKIRPLAARVSLLSGIASKPPSRVVGSGQRRNLPHNRS